MEILNPWNSTKLKKAYYNEGSPIYSNGEYKIYRQSQSVYLYAFKNMAFNQLAGLNKEHLDNVASRTVPENDFLYNRALENLAKCEELLTD